MSRATHGTRKHAKSNPQGVVSIAADGYGFVQTPEGEFFVPASKMGGAFDGDVVEIVPVSVNRSRPQPGKAHNEVGKRPTARVVSVIQRAHGTVVGRYEIAEPFGVVIPEDTRIRHDIFTMHADNPHVREGDVVRVRITQYPSRNSAATGVVEEVVGRAGTGHVAVDALVAAHNLRVAFPPQALSEAEAVQVDADQALACGYVDVRDRCVFTIDPPDARDFDDALSLDAVEGGWRMGVHIADVSWYMRPGMALDAEARLRSTSVYLVDRVIPMLPEALSNGVCSLAPGQDRRTLTVDVLLDDEGCVQDASFYPALIRSDARLDYGQVQRFLEGGDAAGIPAPVAERLEKLSAFAQAFKRERLRCGALDLETTEAHVALDADGVPTGVSLRRQTVATELVEQCMVLANSLVAHVLAEKGEPAVFRMHDAPEPAALGMLVPLLREFDYAGQVDLDAFAAGNTRALQRVLELSRGGEEAELVSTLLLRSLKRAAYYPECRPHFGLGLEEYLHFTSPIRRYPDLVAHRALKRCLGLPGGQADAAAAGIGGDVGVAAASRSASNLAFLAEHASAMERTADEAARESQTLKLVEYLSHFIGDAFEGTISRVASYGFFVRLDNTATGLVALGQAGDEPFSLDVRRQLLVGQETGRVFRLGQRIRVRLDAARPTSRELDFSLVGSD